MRSKVDFPTPWTKTRPKISALRTAKLTSSRTVTPCRRTVTCFSSISGGSSSTSSFSSSAMSEERRDEGVEDEAGDDRPDDRRGRDDRDLAHRALDAEAVLDARERD